MLNVEFGPVLKSVVASWQKGKWNASDKSEV